MKRYLIILGFLGICNILAWLAVWDLSQDSLEVIFFDVGQGDAIFIETPQRYQILIDGGPGSAVLEKLGKEMPFWDRTIDLAILTHPHSDHLAGLLEVLKRYKVQNILWTGVACDSALCEEWRKSIEGEGAKIYLARAGLEINEVGGELFSASSRRTVLRVLYPLASLEGQEASDLNNTSIVARLVYGEKSFLFTGDAYESVGIDSNVLKVAHHGSKNSISREFIEAVSPEIAVISVGQDNKYGHPHEETLAVLENYGIKVLRTDINNDIKILCNSHSLEPKLKD